VASARTSNVDSRTIAYIKALLHGYATATAQSTLASIAVMSIGSDTGADASLLLEYFAPY